MALKLNSSGGGSVTLDAPVTASNYTITVPASSGTVATLASVTNNGVVYINSSGQATSGSGLVFDSSGNLGLGVTPSAWSLPAFESTYGLIGGVSEINITQNAYYNAGWKYKATAVSAKYSQFAGNHAWYTAPSGTAGNAISFTQAMTLENTAASNTQLTIAQTTSSTVFQSNGQDFYLNMRGTGSTIFRNGYGDIERMRIDASGNVLVGTTSALGGTISASTGSNSWAGWFQQRQGAGSSVMLVEYSAAAPNSTTDYFGLFRDNAAQRIQLRANGGIGNYSANNVNLSDERTKTDIQDAGSYLEKICAIPVRTFKYKDQTDGLLNLGCIAQEVEAIAPELVDVSGFGETPEDGVPLKSIYQTDLQYALMKCIQEQQEQINQLKAEVAALKGA